MALDLPRFFKASNPSRTSVVGDRCHPAQADSVDSRFPQLGDDGRVSNDGG